MHDVHFRTGDGRPDAEKRISCSHTIRRQHEQAIFVAVRLHFAESRGSSRIRIQQLAVGTDSVHCRMRTLPNTGRNIRPAPADRRNGRLRFLVERCADTGHRRKHRGNGNQQSPQIHLLRCRHLSQHRTPDETFPRRRIPILSIQPNCPEEFPYHVRRHRHPVQLIPEMPHPRNRIPAIVIAGIFVCTAHGNRYIYYLKQGL